MQFVYMSQISVFLQRTITTLLWLAGAVVFFRWLLTPLLPFLLALALSAMVEPTVERVRRFLRVRRSFAAAVVTTGLLLALGGAAAAMLLRLGMELRQWSERLPEAVAAFPGFWNRLLDRVGPGTPLAPRLSAPPWTPWRTSSWTRGPPSPGLWAGGSWERLPLCWRLCPTWGSSW